MPTTRTLKRKLSKMETTPAVPTVPTELTVVKYPVHPCLTAVPTELEKAHSLGRGSMFRRTLSHPRMHAFRDALPMDTPDRLLKEILGSVLGTGSSVIVKKVLKKIKDERKKEFVKKVLKKIKDERKKECRTDCWPCQ